METRELESEGKTECKRNGADICLACVVFGVRGRRGGGKEGLMCQYFKVSLYACNGVMNVPVSLLIYDFFICKIVASLPVLTYIPAHHLVVVCGRQIDRFLSPSNFHFYFSFGLASLVSEWANTRMIISSQT